MVRKLIVSLTCVAFTACGADKGETSSKEEAKTGDVEFSGYVQKAFTIKVNGEEFKDSEDFYTRFIEELVKPAYPDVADADVKLEGKYGLDEFGSQSKVYMSSVVGEGHLYEGRTDAQSKFTIQVQAKALDETYKARIVVRIGLEIAKSGDGSDLKYCYLLHGNKDGIAISDSSKPIIFEEFATQLTKYKCEDVNEDALVIPGLEGEAKTAKATVDTTVNISLAPKAEWQGASVLTAASLTKSGELLIAKQAVKVDGKWCTPTYRFASIGGTGQEACEGSEDAQPADATSVYLEGDALTLVRDSDEHMLRVGQYTTNGKKVCSGAACKDAPVSNRCDLGYPQAAAIVGGSFMVANGVNSQGSGYCGANAIHVLSADLAYQKAYSIDVPDFATSKLASDGSNIYLLSLAADKLVVRKLKLTEE